MLTTNAFVAAVQNEVSWQTKKAIVRGLQEESGDNFFAILW